MAHFILLVKIIKNKLVDYGFLLNAVELMIEAFAENDFIWKVINKFKESFFKDFIELVISDFFLVSLN